jgi:hypothetical protein
MLEETAKPSERRPIVIGKVWGIILLPVLLVVGAVGAPLSILYTLRKRRIWAQKERRFAEQLSDLGRTMSFDDFYKAVEEGRGTVICEWQDVFKGPVRLWWTPDDIYAATPYPCIDHVHMANDPTYRPFLDWCFQQYVSPSIGKALYVVASSAQRKSLRASLWTGLDEKSRKLDIPTPGK